MVGRSVQVKDRPPVRDVELAEGADAEPCGDERGRAVALGAGLDVDADPAAFGFR